MKFIERIEPYFSGRFWFIYKLLNRLDGFLYRCFFKYDFLNRLLIITMLIAIITMLLCFTVLARSLMH